MNENLPGVDMISDIRRQRAERRRRRLWSKSQLIVFRAELINLRKEGATLGDMRFWLKEKHQIKVERSTILRFLKKHTSDLEGK
jgi:hypothetical protein